MLADVIKQLKEEQRKLQQEEENKYNHPYKRDTIIYFSVMYKLGGIQTWIQNLSKEYEFSVVYDTGDKERLDYLNSLGIETIKHVGQPIECDTLLTCVFGNSDDIKAKRRILVVHGDYKVLPLEDIPNIPKHDEVVAVSKVAAKHFEEVSGEKTRCIYNPVEIFPTTKPLIIGVFSRLSKEKGGWRVKHLIKELKASNKPFLMLIFTDLPFEEDDKRVIFLEPTMNPSGWMEKCDYICQLSDTEAGCLTMQEALKMKKPIIITKLPILEEFGVNESNAKILEFDMSNLDIEDLWNIPKVQWKEPISKEWDEIMKKRVFREKQAEISPGTIETVLNTEEKTEKPLKSPSKTKKKVK
jgi:hypothetical protein